MQNKIKIVKVNEQPVKHIAANVYKNCTIDKAVSKYIEMAKKLN